MVSRSQRTATWIARIGVAVVFVVNVQCAVGFIVAPEQFAAAYEQNGAAGNAAMQGLGVAFLMWNATYPLVIVNPWRHRTLFAVVLAQQAIGLVGESAIMASLPAGHTALVDSIGRFIAFDAFGLIIMGLAFLLLDIVRHRQKR